MKVSPLQLSRILQAKSSTLKREIADAEEATIKEAHRLAVKYSSGTFVARGAYSKRRPKPHPDPSIINVGTRAFLNAWTWTLQVRNDGYTKTRLYQRPVRPYFQYMQVIPGRKLMVDRPIIERIEKELRPIRIRNLETAVRRGMRAR